MSRLGGYKALSPEIPAHTADLLRFLRVLLEESGLSLAALGRLMHYDRSRISRLINGETPIDEHFVCSIVEIWSQRAGVDAESTQRQRQRGLDLLRHAQRGQQPTVPAALSTSDTHSDPDVRPDSIARTRTRRRAALVVVMLLVATMVGDGRDPSRSLPSLTLGSAADLNRLVLYWDPDQEDNMLAAEDVAHGGSEPELAGYRAAGFDSYALSHAPSSGASCVIPLVRFVGRQSDGDLDQVTTADPVWLGGGAPAGYAQRAVVGYIYRPDLPQPPGTKALYRLYSPARGYFTTSQKEWAGPPGAIKSRGYVVERMEGYVLEMTSEVPSCRY